MLLFSDFIASFSTNSCIKSSKTAERIYYNIIWKEEVRIAMAEASDANKPAIYISGPLVESYCSCDPDCDLDLTNETVRKTIGRMNAAALEPLGYTQKRKTVLPKDHTCKYFASGSVFEKTSIGEEKIEKRIVPVK